MSKGAKQALFVILAAVVIVAVAYSVTAGRTASNVPASLQGAQAQEQVDPAILQRIQTLESTVKSGTKDVQVLSELGELYFETGQLDKASTVLASAVEIDPGNAPLHFVLGLSYFWTGRSQEAVAEYKKAIQLDPTGTDYYFNLALAQSHNQVPDVPAAIENWKKVIALAPDSPIAKKSQEYIDKNQSGTRDTATAPPVGKP